MGEAKSYSRFPGGSYRVHEAEIAIKHRALTFCWFTPDRVARQRHVRNPVGRN